MDERYMAPNARPQICAGMKAWLLFLVLISGLLRARGPEPIGPFGGSAAVVEADAYRPGTVMAATSDAQLFQSTNNGDSWKHLPFPAALRASLHAFVIAARTGTYLAGLTDDTQEYAGIFQSRDAGRSWRRLEALGRRGVWSIAVWKLDSNVVAAGADDGVFLSRDAGEHWARISPESNRALQPVVSLAFDTPDSRIIYAGTPHLPWKTVDGGKTWTPSHAGLHDDSDVFSIHVDVTRPFRLFAGACSGIYQSINQGASWTKIVESAGASDRTYQITQHPNQPDVMFAGTTHGLVKSTDRGRTWRRLTTQGTRWITFDPARPSRIFIATDEAGLARSEDLGDSLQPINEGFCNRRVLSFAAAGEILYASSAGPGGGGAFRFTRSGRDWENLTSLPRSAGRPILQLMALDAAQLYALTPKSLLRSPDGGLTWTSVSLPPTITRLTAMLVPSVENRRLLIGAENGIWYSDDLGKKWMPAHMPKGQFAIRSMVATGGQSIAATTATGMLIARYGIEYRVVRFPCPTCEIHGLVATDQGTLLAATSRGLARSENSGATWRAVPGPLDGSTISAICKHPDRSGVIFASRYGDIYGSADDGRSWMRITANEGSLQAIRHLVVAKAIPGAIFAVTHSNGIYTVFTESTLTVDNMRGQQVGFQVRR